MPPGCTDAALGGPKANFGSRQVAHACLPEADSEGSKNIARPSSRIAATLGVRSKRVA
jgi:hypothetical protein